jgi:succinylglutamic semialdehyde dehydrogenase
LSPADERSVWSGNLASEEQLRGALQAARTAFFGWAETRVDQRIEACQRYAQFVTANQEELAGTISIETGKPLWESHTEAQAVVAKVANSIDALLTRRSATTEPSGEFMAVTRYRPHGVMLVLGPFNLPAHLPGAHIVPALLAGNVVVFKPSEWALATGQWLVRAWEHAGLPAGVLNFIPGGADLAIAGVQDESVDGVLFTGSVRAGLSIHRSLAGNPQKILALEMGGNNPLVIHDCHDLDRAAITALVSAYITSGQRCTCARRLIITGEANYRGIVERLQSMIPKIRVGLPFDAEQPFMGPLIHKQAADSMLAAQQDLLAAGASPCVPLARSARSSALLSPGLMEASAQLTLADCEHFGPLLVAQHAKTLDEAISLAGQTRFGLSAGFIGDRIEDFHYFLHRVRAGIVNWNRQTTGASGKLPFGGIGFSGNHRPSGYFAADYCSYPIASLESHDLGDASHAIPGLEF